MPPEGKRQAGYGLGSACMAGRAGLRPKADGMQVITEASHAGLEAGGTIGVSSECGRVREIRRRSLT